MKTLVLCFIVTALLTGCATLAPQEPDTATGYGVDNAGGVDAGSGIEGGK